MARFNSRAYSRLGQSGSVFGMELLDLRKEFPIKVVSADMSVVSGLDRYKRTYPDDFYNVGIAEQNMLGVAAGLSGEGFKSIAVAQACFLSMRSFEQIRQYLGYMENDVVCVGINSGFSLTFFGNTHYAIEDISIMKSIPNMCVLSPSDAGQAVKLFSLAVKSNRPVYLRLAGSLNCPIVYKSEIDFEIGVPVTLRDGNDIVIYSTGSMVNVSLDVANLLNEHSIDAKVVDVHTIKPFDSSIVVSEKDKKIAVTVEEHNIIGGLGSTIADAICERGIQLPLLKLGINDQFMSVGDYDFLCSAARLQPQQIVEDILNRIRLFQ